MGLCDYGNKFSGCLKITEFFEQLHNFQHFQEDLFPWIKPWKMDSWYRILRPTLLRPKKVSMTLFLLPTSQPSSSIKKSKQLSPSCNHTWYSKRSLSLPSFPNPLQGQRISGLNCSKKYHVFSGYSCCPCENHTTDFSLAYSTTCNCKSCEDHPMFLSITRYMLWT